MLSGFSALLNVWLSPERIWVHRTVAPGQLCVQEETRSIISQTAPGFLYPEGYKWIPLNRSGFLLCSQVCQCFGHQTFSFLTLQLQIPSSYLLFIQLFLPFPSTCPLRSWRPHLHITTPWHIKSLYTRLILSH